ncbi:MAG: winged helix-turn-helix domain-containing protein [Leptolyngbya sp.]|nr:winged helix-turn-helix domain-containing protein [Leptolyngbya sp.]
MRILLTIADPLRQPDLFAWLTRQGMVVDRAWNGDEAWNLLQACPYDLVVLAANLPGLDGLSLCRRLRQVGNPVLIMLLLESANPDIEAQALDGGADACLAPPMWEGTLLAHLRALARRGKGRANPVLHWGPVQINPSACQATCNGQALTLNRKEYQLLDLFLRHPHRVFSLDDLGHRLWSLVDDPPSDATIKSHISHLRRKLKQAGSTGLIQTRHGQGYGLTAVPDYDDHPSPSPSPDPMDTITAHIWQELMVANARLHEEIEQRKTIETQLRRSETMLLTAQRVAHIGCWEADAKTGETYWTEELFHIHGLDPNQSAPNADQVLAYIYPDDLAIHHEKIVIPATRGETFEVNLRILRADGDVRYVNVRGGPIFDEAGHMVRLIGTTFDITRWVTEPATL